MIKIRLPNPNNYQENIKGFLRQLELSVHHAQKSFEQLEKDKMIDGNSFITYRFPEVGLYQRYELDKENNPDSYVKVHVDEESNQFQNIEIEIA